MYADEVNAKLLAQAQYSTSQRDLGGADVQSYCSTSTAQRSSPQEDAERNHRHHSEQAQKAGEAAKFLALHPEFNRFIELVRQGAIQF